MIHVLLDGDWILYTAGFAGQKTEYCSPDIVDAGEVLVFSGKREIEDYIARDGGYEARIFTREVHDPIEHILHTAKMMINTARVKIEERFRDETELTIFLDGEGNFRTQRATIRPYKGNRKDAKKPEAYEAIRKYLLDNYQCSVANGIESDDALAKRQTLARLRGHKSIIVGVDKDLLQVPGWHMNPNKGFRKVSKQQGLVFLYRQCLTGDPVDNIAGCYQVGKAKAEKLITEDMSERDMWTAVVQAYDDSIKKFSDKDLYAGLSAEEAAKETMDLVYLLRYDGDIWLPPDGR